MIFKNKQSFYLKKNQRNVQPVRNATKKNLYWIFWLFKNAAVSILNKDLLC